MCSVFRQLNENSIKCYTETHYSESFCYKNVVYFWKFFLNYVSIFTVANLYGKRGMKRAIVPSRKKLRIFGTVILNFTRLAYLYDKYIHIVPINIFFNEIYYLCLILNITNFHFFNNTTVLLKNINVYLMSSVYIELPIKN